LFSLNNIPSYEPFRQVVSSFKSASGIYQVEATSREAISTFSSLSNEALQFFCTTAGRVFVFTSGAYSILWTIRQSWCIWTTTAWKAVA